MLKVSKFGFGKQTILRDIFDKDGLSYMAYQEYNKKTTDELFDMKIFCESRLNEGGTEKIEALKHQLLVLTFMIGERVVDV